MSLLDRVRRWRIRRVYRRLARLQMIYLTPPDRRWFSLRIAVTPVIPEPSIEEVEQGAITHVPLTQVERNARWRAKNRLKYNAYMRKYRSRNKEKS